MPPFTLLYVFLLERLSGEELRQIAAALDPDLARALPEHGGRGVLVSALVHALERERRLAGAFFQQLRRRLPRYTARVDEIERAYADADGDASPALMPVRAPSLRPPSHGAPRPGDAVAAQAATSRVPERPELFVPGPSQPRVSAMSHPPAAPSRLVARERWDVALHRLFLDAFANDELRQFIVLYLPRAVAEALPDVAGPRDRYCFEVVELLRRHDACDAEFFAALRSARPRRSAAIEAIEQAQRGEPSRDG